MALREAGAAGLFLSKTSARVSGHASAREEEDRSDMRGADHHGMRSVANRPPAFNVSRAHCSSMSADLIDHDVVPEAQAAAASLG